MRRRQFIALLSGAAAWPFFANAQTPAIGFLSSRSARDSVKVVAAFGEGLREGGFAEGKNLSIEYRFADGALDRLPDMAAELVKRPISALVAVGGRIQPWQRNEQLPQYRLSL
jgi:putative ABC transport system substrate-binding protein